MITYQKSQNHEHAQKSGEPGPIVLEKGVKYDPTRLQFLQWQKEGVVIRDRDVAGYSVDYFFNDGTYLGADADGVEPIMWG